MKYALHPIQEIQPSSIREVARLHESTMRLLLSEMGLPFVVRYFEAAAKDPAVIGFSAVSEASQVIGYVVGTPRPDLLNAQLTKPPVWFARQCLRLLFTRPRVLWQALVSSAAQPGQMPPDGTAIELVYVAVHPDCRGMGLGRALMQAFVDASRSAGYRSVAATQEVDNEASIALFTAMGYRLAQKYREGRYERQRMEFSLLPE